MDRNRAIARSLLLGSLLILAGAARAHEDPTEPESSDKPTRWASSAALTDNSYQWALSRGTLDLGLKFEARSRTGHPADAHVEAGAGFVSPLPSVSVGLQRVVAGATPAGHLVERVAGPAAGSSYVSKMGLEWKPAPSRVYLNQGLGLRLGGDDRLSLRLRKGVLGIYMRRNF